MTIYACIYTHVCVCYNVEQYLLANVGKGEAQSHVGGAPPIKQ